MIMQRFGLNPAGEIVIADDAPKGSFYTCPSCDDEIILHKSGNTGWGSNRPHFVHKPDSAHCSNETVLHDSFKRKIFSYLDQKIKESLPVDFCWKCAHCLDEHSGNLIRSATSVKLETKVEERIPDVSVYRESSPTIAIEVVVHHEPEDQALKFYASRGINVVVYNPKVRDIEKFTDKVIRPDVVITTWCPNPVCAVCEGRVNNNGTCAHCDLKREKEVHKLENAKLLSWKKLKVERHKKQQAYEQARFLNKLRENLNKFSDVDRNYIEQNLKRLHEYGELEGASWAGLVRLRDQLELTKGPK